MWYRILFIDRHGVTIDTVEQDSVTVKDLQSLSEGCKLFQHIFGQDRYYRVLRRNAQNGKWFLYHSNQHILEV